MQNFIRRTCLCHRYESLNELNSSDVKTCVEFQNKRETINVRRTFSIGLSFQLRGRKLLNPRLWRSARY